MRSERATILMVDDRPENLLALEAVLDPLALDVVKASSGEEALRSLMRHECALILMDVEMPGMDGFETAACIKQRERTRDVPIIFLTARQAEASQVFRGYHAGAVDYLTKPFDALVLRAKVSVFIDLHNAKRDAERLAHRASHDAMTGLPNRVVFMDRLEAALARMRRRPMRVAVLFFDLDGFKLVNDTLGHEAGDELLRSVAERLRALVRPSDAVARFGGDEFTVMAEVGDERDVVEIAERIAAAIGTPYHLEAGEAFVSASIGAALASSYEDEPEELVREADAAMYRAKQHGGARHELFDSGMRRRALMRLETETALRRALERKELRVVYQPEVELSTGAVVGVEALLRWEHPEHGLMRPGDFLPLVEQTPLMGRITNFVLDEALSESGRWQVARPGLPPLPVAVNISARQLRRSDLLPSVTRALGRWETAPGLLRLELSEASIADDQRFQVAPLEELKATGVQLALDDFGTGMSSLGSLRDLPLDVVKIDNSVVESIGTVEGASELAGALVKVCHALSLTAVAEGVESPEQATVLRALGYDRALGNYFSAPLSGTEALDLLTGHGSLPLPHRQLTAVAGARVA